MYQSAQHLHQQHTHRNDKTPHLWPYVFFSIIQILVIKISWNWKYNFPFFSQLRNEHFPPNSRKWMLNNQNLLTWVCFWNVINIAIYFFIVGFERNQSIRTLRNIALYSFEGCQFIKGKYENCIFYFGLEKFQTRLFLTHRKLSIKKRWLKEWVGMKVNKSWRRWIVR